MILPKRREEQEPCSLSDVPNRSRPLEVYTPVKEAAIGVWTALLALSCRVTADVVAGTRVHARDDVSATRRFPGGWIRCAAAEDPLTAQPEIWYDLGHVVSVTKLETPR